MLSWERRTGESEIRLVRQDMVVGRIQPTREANSDFQADWAGDRYRLQSVLSWTLAYRIEQPDTGLSARLTFRVTGRRATLQTNVGGQLLLIRIQRRARHWQLWDIPATKWSKTLSKKNRKTIVQDEQNNPDLILNVYGKAKNMSGVIIQEQTQMHRLYLLLIIFSLDRFYARSWSGDYRS